MSPLPNTKVIPDKWAAHHQPVVNRTLTAPGTVYRVVGGPPPYPKPPGRWVGRETIYEGVFDVQPLQREGQPVPGDQPTQVKQYTITTKVVGTPPFRAGENGDIVSVIGREFRIVSLTFGAQLWEVDLTCVDNMTQKNP